MTSRFDSFGLTTEPMTRSPDPFLVRSPVWFSKHWVWVGSMSDSPLLSQTRLIKKEEGWDTYIDVWIQDIDRVFRSSSLSRSPSLSLSRSHSLPRYLSWLCCACVREENRRDKPIVLRCVWERSEEETDPSCCCCACETETDPLCQSCCCCCCFCLY